MRDELKNVNTRVTPQSEPADSRQELNNAGGYTFTIDDVARVRRFLVLGSDGGTYYTTAPKLTKENATVVLDMARNRTEELVKLIVDVSTLGRAPKANPALFALAAAASLGAKADRKLALDALPLVARTGTHLFLFCGYVEQFRGWGRALKRAVANWYLNKSVSDVAFQAVKYRQREGWSHRDLLRLSRPVPKSPTRDRLFKWITTGDVQDYDGLEIIEGFQLAQSASTNDLPHLIEQYRLPWETLPTEALNHRRVWEALLANGLPMGALIRQLPRLTQLGLFESGCDAAPIAAQLVDAEKLRKARMHPMNVLLALRTYSAGHGMRGSETWTPSRIITDALDAAFYASFKVTEPSGKRMLLALDVSTSMTQDISGMPISCSEASAAMALITAATEPDYNIVGFTAAAGPRRWSRDAALTPLNISPRQRMDDAVRAVSNLPFGGTDCSLPMVYAKDKGLSVDTFVIYTDNETWAGKIHPHQALTQYRQHSGINAKLIVCGMTATVFSIADPSDVGSLDVVGFDSAVPTLISNFSRGF
jgi:60 kDa SS-A/Ro ribonucleoprotein